MNQMTITTVTIQAGHNVASRALAFEDKVAAISFANSISDKLGHTVDNVYCAVTEGCLVHKEGTEEIIAGMVAHLFDSLQPISI